MLVLVLFSSIFDFKGIVHPKMKISPWFTHPQVILDVYGILLSDEYNRSAVMSVSALKSV